MSVGNVPGEIVHRKIVYVSGKCVEEAEKKVIWTNSMCIGIDNPKHEEELVSG